YDHSLEVHLGEGAMEARAYFPDSVGHPSAMVRSPADALVSRTVAAAAKPPKAPSIRPTARPAAVPEGRQPGAGRPGLRVLVVEDNVEHAALLGELLELWGNQVELAHDGAAALAQAVSSLPDVVLLDIGLPGMDGYQVAEALRGNAATAQTRLIALTGRAE